MLKSWSPLASYWTRSTRLTLVLLTLVSLPSSVFAQPHEPTDEVALALEPAADMPPPTFFTRPQYRGTAVALPVGDYALADLVAHGMADNTISSLHVAPGFKVEALRQRRTSQGHRSLFRATRPRWPPGSLTTSCRPYASRRLLLGRPSTRSRERGRVRRGASQLVSTRDNAWPAGDWRKTKSPRSVPARDTEVRDFRRVLPRLQ